VNKVVLDFDIVMVIDVLDAKFVSGTEQIEQESGDFKGLFCSWINLDGY
jgi:hypothetical protein